MYPDSPDNSIIGEVECRRRRSAVLRTLSGTEEEEAGEALDSREDPEDFDVSVAPIHEESEALSAEALVGSGEIDNEFSELETDPVSDNSESDEAIDQQSDEVSLAVEPPESERESEEAAIELALRSDAIVQEENGVEQEDELETPKWEPEKLQEIGSIETCGSESNLETVEASEKTTDLEEGQLIEAAELTTELASPEPISEESEPVVGPPRLDEESVLLVESDLDESEEVVGDSPESNFVSDSLPVEEEPAVSPEMESLPEVSVDEAEVTAEGDSVQVLAPSYEDPAETDPGKDLSLTEADSMLEAAVDEVQVEEAVENLSNAEMELESSAEEIEAQVEKLGKVVDIESIPKTKPKRVNAKAKKKVAGISGESTPAKKKARKKVARSTDNKAKGPKKRVSLLDDYFKDI